MSGVSDRGYVLVTALLMLLVLTVIGIAAIGTSTIENLLSGNIRLRESNISQADGCAELSKAVIERARWALDTQGFSNIADAVSPTLPTLPTELNSIAFAFNTDSADVSPDVACDAPAGSVSVDIDIMYTHWIPGAANEMLSGYEGQGKGGASGVYAYYRINSSSAGLLGSTGTVGSIYKYVPK